MNAATNAALMLVIAAAPLEGQGFLEQFSYEGLRFRAIGVEFGVMASDRLTTEPTGAVRVDYGLIAPNVRVLLGAAYFKGDFDSDEIERFETQLRGVVQDPTNDFTITVGAITWTDIQASLDLQYVFDVAPAVRPYVGLGLGVHVRDGDGDAIAGTFVEDALDTIEAGVTGSLGVELTLFGPLALTADVRGELTGELRSVAARGGLMYRLNGGRGR